jgi:predicted metal-dependent HD superfamily phosphohydrolase
MTVEPRLPGGDPADHALAREAFDRAAADLGLSPEKAAAIRADLERRYRSRGRHYHTLDHVAAMARLAQEHQSALVDPSAVQLAIWYHDAVYRARRDDNEADSARLARRDLSGLIEPSRLEAVEKLILATGSHEPVAGLPDSELFLDLDLAILGTEPAVYDAYAKAIRAEYRWVPGPIYRRKRAEVLKGFLARPAIYTAIVMRQRMESAARANLARELLLLTLGRSRN